MADTIDIDIYIEQDGRVVAIYDDVLVPLLDGEPMRTRRASHVEPFGCGWIADMRPVGGPILWDTATTNPLGRVAFRTRAAALAAERAWLDARLAEGLKEATTR